MVQRVSTSRGKDEEGRVVRDEQVNMNPWTFCVEVRSEVTSSLVCLAGAHTCQGRGSVGGEVGSQLGTACLVSAGPHSIAVYP